MIFALVTMGAIILLWVYLANVEYEFYDHQEDYLLCSHPPFIKAMTRLIEAVENTDFDIEKVDWVDAEEVFERLGHGNAREDNE